MKKIFLVLLLLLLSGCEYTDGVAKGLEKSELGKIARGEKSGK